MDEQRRLLQAVLDAPQDDAARLAYADWCDRQSDPRGEFIRLQVQYPDTPGALRSAAGTQRERQLLSANEELWTRSFAGIATAWRFSRGFLEFVEADANLWLKEAGLWLTLQPITRLRVTSLRPVIERFFADEHLLRIRSLYLTDCKLLDDDVEVLAHSSNLRNIEVLELSFNQIGAAGAEALASSQNLPALRTLGFEANRVDLVQRSCRDWDGSVQSVVVPALLLELVTKYGPKPWLSQPAD